MDTVMKSENNMNYKHFNKFQLNNNKRTKILSENFMSLWGLTIMLSPTVRIKIASITC